MKLKILDMLKKTGKSNSWLWTQLNMSWTNFNKMLNNESRSISIKNLETLCEIFECTPNDLFGIK